MKQSINHQLNRGIYQAGVSSIDIMEAARSLDKFSFNVNFLGPKYKPGQYETPFNEMRFANPIDFVPDKYKFVLKEPEPLPGSYADFMAALKKTLINVIDSRVDPAEKYIFFHSAGYDSRIISAAMAEIRDGGRDMSNIHFRCHQPECEDFFKIMSAEGWPRDQYSCWTGPAEDYYDVGRADVCVNGWVPYVQQMNFWSDIIPKEEEKDWILICGLGGEMYKYWLAGIKADFKYCDNRILNLLIDHYPHHGQWENHWATRFKDIFLPMWDYDYLFAQSRINKKYLTSYGRDGGDNVRLDLCKMFPYKIQKEDIPHGEHGYTWNISKKRAADMKELFYSGTFYKHYGKYIPKDIDFINNLYGWEAKLWAFAVTIYDRLCQGQKST